MKTLLPVLTALLIIPSLRAAGEEAIKPAAAADAKPAEVKPASPDTAEAKAAREEESARQLRKLKAAAAETPEAKIARLEERVARLERIVEKLATPPSPQLLTKRGPTAEDRARYEALSEEARTEFREALRAEGERLRELPEEERRKVIVEMFEKVQAADKKRASEGAVKAPKDQPREKPPAKP